MNSRDCSAYSSNGIFWPSPNEMLRLVVEMTTCTFSATGFGVSGSSSPLPFFFLRLGLWQRPLLLVGRVAVELGVFQAAGPGVVEDREVALVDVFAEPRAATLHLLVENGALERARRRRCSSRRGRRSRSSADRP